MTWELDPALHAEDHRLHCADNDPAGRYCNCSAPCCTDWDTGGCICRFGCTCEDCVSRRRKTLREQLLKEHHERFDCHDRHD